MVPVEWVSDNNGKIALPPVEPITPPEPAPLVPRRPPIHRLLGTQGGVSSWQRSLQFLLSRVCPRKIATYRVLDWGNGAPDCAWAPRRSPTCRY